MAGTFVVVIEGLNRIFSPVLRALLVLLIVGAVFDAAPLAQAASGEAEGSVKKVLPYLLDLRGRYSVSPSLFDRDAYQAYLRKHPQEVSGIQYAVLWKAREVEGTKLTVRVELRGLFEEKFPRQTTLEKTLDGSPSMNQWTRLELTGAAYARFGKINAWRATLWSGDEMLDEYKSFLW